MSDRIALMDFYQLTLGTYWYQKWNWGSELGYKQWYGISVDKSGHVSTIQLRENYLRGSLEKFSSMKYLKNLIVFSIFSNNIQGSLPSEIGNLSYLQELNISWNQFSGCLPESFYELKALRVLKIDHNNFMGILSKKLGDMKELRYLNVSYNLLEGELPMVGDELLHLTSIDFTFNPFTSKFFNTFLFSFLIPFSLFLFLYLYLSL